MMCVASTILGDVAAMTYVVFLMVVNGGDLTVLLCFVKVGEQI